MVHSRGVILAASIVLVLAVASCKGETVGEHRTLEFSFDTLPDTSVEDVRRIYDSINQVPLSEIEGELRKAIEERVACYNSTPLASTRISECRKAYSLKLLTAARREAQAMPLLGETVLCFQYCPIFHALCRGENLASDPDRCVLQETRCVEHCLDKYWRGTTFSRDVQGR